METKKLLEIIRANLENGKLSCGAAHKISEEHNVSLAEIGKLCDEEKIKIFGCQMGCF